MSQYEEDFLLPDATPVRTGLLPQTAEDEALVAAAPMYGEEFYLEDKDIQKLLANDTYKTWRRVRRKWLINQGSLGSCFPAGTLIRMADGSSKPIEDVKTLDMVLTAEGNTHRVVRTMVRPAESIYTLNLWGHKHLQATGEHPILTKRGYVRIQDLTSTDWVAIPRFLPQTTREIQVWELLDKPIGVNKERCIHANPGRIKAGILGRKVSEIHRAKMPETIELDRDFGWLLGIFLAEGSLNYSKITFHFHRKERDTLAKRVEDTLLSRFGVKCTTVIRNNQCQVKMYGAVWTALFHKLCGYGCQNKNLHPLVMSGPREFLEGLIEGWMQGDGLGSDDKAGGVTVSHSLAMSMYDIATYLGYQPRIESLWPKINPKHKIKTRQRRWIVTWPKSETRMRCEQTDTHVWRNVREVTKADFTGWVYNIEVEHDHSYVAEGIGVHNCNAAATIGAFYNRRHLDGLAHIPLSVNYLYMHINGGRDQGSTLAAGIEFAKKGVAPIELSRDGEKWKFPLTVYNTRQVPQNWLKIAREESATFQSFEAYKLPVGNYTMFKRAVASALARDHQIIHAWHVGRNSMSLRNGYVVVGRGPGNHATLAHSAKWVGGSDLIEIDMQNSWCKVSDPIYGPPSSGWGEDGGFGLMKMDDFAACSKMHSFWILVGNKMTSPLN